MSKEKIPLLQSNKQTDSHLILWGNNENVNMEDINYLIKKASDLKSFLILHHYSFRFHHLNFLQKENIQAIEIILLYFHYNNVYLLCSVSKSSRSDPNHGGAFLDCKFIIGGHTNRKYKYINIIYVFARYVNI